MRISTRRSSPSHPRRLGIETLERKLTLSSAPVITPADVQQLLERAAAAANTNQAIIAVVDRNGTILGVREEQGVLNSITDKATQVFAIDGAVAEARTAAFFANDTAPLTSRTVRFISQSTITQREVQSSPEVTDPNSPLSGPGLVAPIGVGGHFPPGISPTDSADLFEIELSNRDTSSTATVGTERFNVPLADVPAGQQISAPDSYGVQSTLLPGAQSRGIGTLPGGIPLYKNGTLVGGIGVFFPGPNGYASYEQGFVPGINQTDYQRTNAPLELTAEWMAFAAAGGSAGGNAPVGTLAGVAPVHGYGLPFGVITLGGITLDVYGPGGSYQGIKVVAQTGAHAGVGNPHSGADQPVDGAHDKYLTGKPVPTGWLVYPHAGSGMTTAQVTQIIDQGITEASITRAQIRLPAGSTTRMTFAVSDKDGNLLALYRMPDATVFSMDIAVAKARNTAYYDNASLVQSEDLLTGIAAGTALNNRDFRYVALPNFPTGTSGAPPGQFSGLNDPGINPLTAENIGAPLPARVYEQPTATPSGPATSVVGYASFKPYTNFRDTNDAANQNGVVFFPGSTPIYKNGSLTGGVGISGDGVNQDDFVTYYASQGFGVPNNVVRADQTFYQGVRLPYFIFPRNATNL
jgi:uncharacterized protein GlcG (DUF336 family)